MARISTILLSYLLFHPFSSMTLPEAPPHPKTLMVSFRDQLWAIDEKDLENWCKQVQKDRRRIYYLINRSFRMSFQVKGVYTHQGLLFFRLAISNRSHLDYNVDSIRFFMWDSKDHRKNVPLIHLPAVYSYGNTSLIHGKSQEECVVVLPQVTLPVGKYLVIELTEKQGGRKLELFVSNFTLLRSRLI
jgi:hypothetical protein